jgi:hypothetical protein
VLFSQIKDTHPLTRGYGQFAYLYDLATEGIFVSFIVLVLGFFPGLFYYRIGKEKTNPGSLVELAFILKVVSAVIMIITGSIVFYIYIFSGDRDPIGVLIVVYLGGVIALVVYCIGTLLLIVYKCQTRDFKLGIPEKVVLPILFIMLLIVGVVYGMAIYEKKTRSIEKCDSIKNPIDRDICHYFLSMKRPDLAICEKIRDTYPKGIWWRDGCYRSKAQYFKDPTYCENIQEERFKELCKEQCFEDAR